MESSDFERKERLNIVIDRAGISDLEAIQKLNQELCAKENRDFDETINPEFPFSKNGEEYFRTRIESPDGLALIAKEGQEAIGYLLGGMVAPEDYRTITSVAELENMYVRESSRGKGIGGKLMQKFEDWCKERKVQRIRIVASAGNSEAIRFYKAHGSKEVNLTLEKELISE